MALEVDDQEYVRAVGAEAALHAIGRTGLGQGGEPLAAPDAGQPCCRMRHSTLHRLKTLQELPEILCAANSTAELTIQNNHSISRCGQLPSQMVVVPRVGCSQLNVNWSLPRAPHRRAPPSHSGLP